MPSQITPEQYGHAVLDHVQDGSYPDSEELISAELPSFALKELSQQIKQAKEDVKVRIRKSSKKSAQDVDGWISQAKQLRVDIQRSQEIAREVIEGAQHNERLQERVQDATNKMDLLEAEINFNQNLGETLGNLQATQRTLESAQKAILDEKLAEAVELLRQADGALTSHSRTRSIRISSVLQVKVIDLRNHVKEKLISCWDCHIHVSPEEGKITVRRELAEPYPMSLDSLVDILAKSDHFGNILNSLCRQFDSLIIQRRLEVRSDGKINSLKVAGDEISISGLSPDLSAQTLFHDLDPVIDFLHTRLPPSIFEPLANYLIPHLVSRLISVWLVSAVPEDLDGMEDFEDTLNLVNRFGERLKSFNWRGHLELTKWIESIPTVWLKKRQEISLDRVRKLLSRGLGGTETVERTETQMLSRNDEVFAGNGAGDDWNAGWSDEEMSPSASKETVKYKKLAQDEEEEDVSAWGLDDDDESGDFGATQGEPDGSRNADEDGEAWGWGDEEESESIEKQATTTTSSPPGPKVNRVPQTASQAEREVTLRETYTVSMLPKELLEIIDQVVADAARLETPECASLRIAPVAPALLTLPGLILAMYRASSSVSYSQHSTGQMFLYNDSLWLTDQLHHLHTEHQTKSKRQIPSRMSYNLKLPEQISALESFGRRAYAKEMESQRTIITDLLDGAQGFVHCTEHPFAREADLAIASATDRVRQLHREWSKVLSSSALLQSLGSLLSTVINKMIIDIEDMSDISEPESQQLASYCKRITTLEDLFHPSQGGAKDSSHSEEEIMPMTALYTPHWLKFRYLDNILESSLVDIKYLWTEGELGLEFDTEELVDLIVALFADSPHRRTAVAEIRGRRGVR